MRKQTSKTVWIPAIGIAGLLLIWELICRIGLVPAFMLPAPSAVVVALVRDASLLAAHSATTLVEAAAGLVIGVALGLVLALLMDKFETIYLLFSPIITVSQTIPTIAIAPLLVLWLGYGLLPKIVLIALTTFFPVAVSLVDGLRSVDADLLDLMRTMGASTWDTYRFVKLPAAAPHLFSGLKISAAYAIVSAVIAEWLGGFSGLGVYMTRVRKSFSYDKMFASILVISVLSLALMRAVDGIEYLALPWKRGERNEE